MVSATRPPRHAELPHAQYESVVHTIVQSPDRHLFDLMGRASHVCSPLEGTMIAVPLMSICRTFAAQFGPIAASLGQRCIAMREGRFGNWLPFLLAATTALNGWLLLGPLAQSTLMAAEVFRRLRRAMGTARGRTNEVE